MIGLAAEINSCISATKTLDNLHLLSLPYLCFWGRGVLSPPLQHSSGNHIYSFALCPLILLLQNTHQVFFSPPYLIGVNLLLYSMPKILVGPTHCFFLLVPFDFFVLIPLVNPLFFYPSFLPFSGSIIPFSGCPLLFALHPLSPLCMCISLASLPLWLTHHIMQDFSLSVQNK